MVVLIGMQPTIYDPCSQRCHRNSKVITDDLMTPMVPIPVGNPMVPNHKPQFEGNHRVFLQGGSVGIQTRSITGISWYCMFIRKQYKNIQELHGHSSTKTSHPWLSALQPCVWSCIEPKRWMISYEFISHGGTTRFWVCLCTLIAHYISSCIVHHLP